APRRTAPAGRRRRREGAAGGGYAQALGSLVTLNWYAISAPTRSARKVVVAANAAAPLRPFSVARNAVSTSLIASLGSRVASTNSPTASSIFSIALAATTAQGRDSVA